MEIQNNVITSAPVDAATLLILRDLDEAKGIEVFMIRRHAKSSVLGGVYVFPGGKVDKKDSNVDLLSRIDVDTEVLKQSLNEPELSAHEAAAIFVATIRETYEECGVLFAKPLKESHLVNLKPYTNEDPLLEHLDMKGLALNPSQLVPFSRWITPQLASVMSKRFDTRFFIAKSPDLQEAKHDNFEAIESAWFTPRQALEKYWNHEIEMAPPQIMSLVNLSFFDRVDEALEHYRSRAPACIRPQPFDVDGVRHICYPGHPRHPESQKAMRGPSLLKFSNQRFEPQEGYEAFFKD
jgi:8-oxo-dGTP pyrophosphatase MutT (NUDIX family)